MNPSSPAPLSHRNVWALAGPIIVSNISVPLVGAVDTAVVGHLDSPHYIGAVALGALIFSFLYWGFGFLRMGTSGFIARAYGAEDKLELSQITVRVVLLGLLLGLIVILFSVPLIRFALYLLESSEQVEQLTADYAGIRIWSAPATLLIYVFTGILIGLHNTRHVFVIQIVLNLTNVVLDLIFVPVLELGVKGVAWATLIAEYTAAITGIWLLRKPLADAFKKPDWQQVLAYQALMDLIKTNSHIFVRTLCLVFSFSFFTAQSAKLGEVILATNAILLHLHSITAYGLDGFAHAAEALVGSAYGAKSRTRFKRAVALTTLWAGIIAVVFSIIYWLFGSMILSLFTDIENVLQTADQYLIWMIIAPMISIWSFQLDGIFIGTGYAREMRDAMVVSTLGYLLLVYLFQPMWGNHGLFFALSGFMILRALTLWVYYPRMVRSIQTV